MSWTMLKVHIPLVALPLFISMAFALSTPGGPLNPTSDSALVYAPDVDSSARHQDEDFPRLVSSTPTPPPSDTTPLFVASSTTDPEPVLSVVEGATATAPPASPPLPAPPPPPATTPAPAPSPVPAMTADQACDRVRAYVTAEMASVVVTFKSCAAELIDGLFVSAAKIHNPTCPAANGPCQHHSLTLKLYIYENGLIVPADGATTLILKTY